MLETPPAPAPPAAGFAQRVGHALEALPEGADAAQVWRALGAHGVQEELYATGAPTGPVPDPGRLAALLTAVDARGDNGVTLSVLVQTASALPLLATGTAAPALAAYRQAVAGAASVALAATDAQAPGSDLTALGTEYTVEGGELVLRGGKRWVTGACAADHLLVLARHRPGRHFTNFTWVLVPADAPGVSVRPADSELLTASGTGHIDLDAVRLPTDHLVGRPGRAMASFARHMATERLAGAQWAVALTRRVLIETRRRLTGRSVDGQPLWHHPAVRQDFASCLVRVAQLRALLDTLTPRIAGERDLAAAGLLKAAVGQTVDAVLSRCAQLQGADGLARRGAAHVRAEAAVFGLGGGATELMLAQLADRADAVLEELAPCR
ncbi:acyl-CoA dehydrogenase [Streptomyces sparsogenes]|uniref:acyl-CoA dehydrogenase family protein n=1 Tax=Streptomyces sparsogenes TaxID=67365 RepID=UPI0033D96A19